MDTTSNFLFDKKERKRKEGREEGKGREGQGREEEGREWHEEQKAEGGGSR